MSLEQTRHVFGCARVLIGAHGGAMYNLHFAPKTATIIEYIGVHSDGHITSKIGHTMIWTLAQNTGQTFYRVYEKPLSSQLDIEVNIHKLLQLLHRIDKLH